MKYLLLYLSVAYLINWDVEDKSRDKGSKSRSGYTNSNDTGNAQGPNSRQRVTKERIKKEDLKEYLDYCEASYKFYKKKENYKLERLVVIFRHGDRAPLKNIGDDWANKNCVKCPFQDSKISPCKTKKCECGDLTAKGAKQLQNLGSFIKKNYKPLLFEKDISLSEIGLRATKIERTHSSLVNLVKGLTGANEIDDVDVRDENDSLLRPRRCGFIDNQFAKDIEVYEDLENKIESLGVNDPKKMSYISDEIRCSMCNDVPIPCASKSTCSDTLTEIVKLSSTTWNKQIKNVSSSEIGKKIVFGRFAQDLLDILDSDKLLYLVSAHDGTLSMILSAISSATYSWPPYASAIFIEVWCKYGRQQVRIIFNDKLVEFSEGGGEYVPIARFTSFLEKMRIDNSEMESLCNIGGPKKDGSVTNNLIEMPILKALKIDLPVFWD